MPSMSDRAGARAAQRASRKETRCAPSNVTQRDATKCPLVENGNPMFFDGNHLSIFGALKTSPLSDGAFASLRPATEPNAGANGHTHALSAGSPPTDRLSKSPYAD